MPFYVAGFSVEISAEDSDFRQLKAEGLIILYGSFGKLRGSPTQQGIRAIEELSAVEGGSLPASVGEVVVTSSPVSTAGAATETGRAGLPPIEADLERLIERKEAVDVPTAARYLQLTPDHVWRLVRKTKLVRVGQGRIKVSTQSLRNYKHTQSA